MVGLSTGLYKKKKKQQQQQPTSEVKFCIFWNKKKRRWQWICFKTIILDFRKILLWAMNLFALDKRSNGLALESSSWHGRSWWFYLPPRWFDEMLLISRNFIIKQLKLRCIALLLRWRLGGRLLWLTISVGFLVLSRSRSPKTTSLEPASPSPSICNPSKYP